MFNHYAFMNRDSWEDVFQILFGSRMSKGWAYTDRAQGVQVPREEGAMPGSMSKLDELLCWVGAQATDGSPTTASSPTAPKSLQLLCPTLSNPSPAISHHSVTAGVYLFLLELEMP